MISWGDVEEGKKMEMTELMREQIAMKTNIPRKPTWGLSIWMMRALMMEPTEAPKKTQP